MVIFGAGASYDSLDDNNVDPVLLNENYHPPLAAQLFDQRRTFGNVIERYPQFQPIVSDLREAVREGREIEAELEHLKADASKYPVNHRYLAAIQYYLRDVLLECGGRWSSFAHGVTNYATLLNQIDRWRLRESPHEPVSLVTFNYDTMLDNACRQFGFDPRTMNDYLSWRDYLLFKPHGSVNWARVSDRVIDEPIMPDEVVQTVIREAPISLTDEFILTLPTSTTHKIVRGPTEVLVALQPAIAIPVEQKQADSFACPEFHLVGLRDVLPRVKKLLVVGWRGSEGHFIDLWRTSGARVDLAIVVSESEASSEAIMNGLVSATIADNATQKVAVGGGFRGFVRSGVTIQRLLSGDLPEPT